MYRSQSQGKTETEKKLTQRERVKFWGRGGKPKEVKEVSNSNLEREVQRSEQRLISLSTV